MERACRASVRFVVAVLAVGIVLGAGGWCAGASAPPPTPTGGVRYQPPLDAPIIDPFRPPDQPWLPGNRGLEYETVPGTVVGAIGPGLVVFAGPVAGQLYVTVLHPDGIRSSYSYLAAVHVAVGDRVVVGQSVGVSGAIFHLGARIGETYIDPASLFGTLVGSASTFLVPLGPGSAAPRVPGRGSPGDRAGPAPGVRPVPRGGAGAGAAEAPAPVATTVGTAVEAAAGHLGAAGRRALERAPLGG